MSAIISALALFAFAACHQSTRSDDIASAKPSPPSAISDADTDSTTFEEVLEIAKSNLPDAQLLLVNVREEGKDPWTRLLAARILNSWDEEANTFYSASPRPLQPTCIDTEVLKSMFPGETEAARLYFEIRVDASGKPVRADVQRGAENRQLRSAVVHSLMQSRFLPAKPGENYLDGTVTVECRLEVK